jgi:hypothetical protein
VTAKLSAVALIPHFLAASLLFPISCRRCLLWQLEGTSQHLECYNRTRPCHLLAAWPDAGKCITQLNRCFTDLSMNSNTFGLRKLVATSRSPWSTPLPPRCPGAPFLFLDFRSETRPCAVDGGGALLCRAAGLRGNLCPRSSLHSRTACGETTSVTAPPAEGGSSGPPQGSPASEGRDAGTRPHLRTAPHHLKTADHDQSGGEQAAAKHAGLRVNFQSSRLLYPARAPPSRGFSFTQRRTWSPDVLPGSRCTLLPPREGAPNQSHTAW